MKTFEDWAGSLVKKPVKEQIYDYIKKQSLEAFAADDPRKLSTIKQIAIEIGLARNSVQCILLDLEEEGRINILRATQPYHCIVT